MPLFVLLIYLSTPLYDRFANEYINNSLKQAFFTYAIVRSFNGMISTLQESSISFGIGVDANIALGQVLDPINDAIERFSDMITLSLWVLGAEKIIYEISKFNIIFFIFLILFIVYFFKESKLVKSFLMILIILRLFIPFSAISSSYLDDKIFKPSIDKYEKVLIKTKTDNNISNISSLKEKIKFYIKNSENILNAFINLSIVYFSKFLLNLILLPLLFGWIIKNIFTK
ncbi:hypothetical protein FE773_06135 [Caminibacter mediatlanticus TB-2]|uniref:TrbL/VirB6 plasmid conjugal transfer family protein n=1 Tax=Caminibacter mediatlanticus TB-2 TaxID=391592 RepID=A0ABX5V913_9BACT|nr:hypothetical protein [Caminibacter mediatlanticus]QCT94772.1 hypothetical protein FE773_06135 [Caminibacter mediatlanticus TB-2]